MRLPRLHTQRAHTAQRRCTHTHAYRDNIVIVLRLPSERHAPNAANCICILQPQAARQWSDGVGEAVGRVLPLFVRLIAQLRALPSPRTTFLSLCVCADNLHWAFHFKCLPSFIIRRNCKSVAQRCHLTSPRTHTNTRTHAHATVIWHVFGQWG